MNGPLLEKEPDALPSFSPRSPPIGMGQLAPFSMRLATRSASIRRRKVASALGLGVFILFFLGPLLNLVPRMSMTKVIRDLDNRMTSVDDGQIDSVRVTKVLAHAPGFTVIENLYWYNHTYILLTDQPWHIPQQSHIANLHFDPDTSTNGHVPVKVWSIRNNPVSPEVKEEDQLGSTISLERAMEMSKDAEELQSPMMISNDSNFVSHMYHWIGEMFLGSWRVWSNYAFRSGLTLPEIKVVSFVRTYGRGEEPAGTDNAEVWEDGPGANKWFTEKIFPGVTIESRSAWEDRAEAGKLAVVPLAILSDRSGGHYGPSSAGKPFGDVFRLPVLPDWLTGLRNRVLNGYKAPVSLRRTTSIPKVLYLSRQGSGRQLAPNDHQRLVDSLKELQLEGLADVEVTTFSSAMSFQDQVAKVSTSDIFISVHGNGLTHIMWMNPGASVFEIMPAGCVATDYGPLAIVSGVQHYMVRDTSICVPRDCPNRGCEPGAAINNPNVKVDSAVVTDQIRRIITGRAEDLREIPVPGISRHGSDYLRSYD